MKEPSIKFPVPYPQIGRHGRGESTVKASETGIKHCRGAQPMSLLGSKAPFGARRVHDCLSPARRRLVAMWRAAVAAVDGRGSD
jgi:hypothetical protein